MVVLAAWLSKMRSKFREKLQLRKHVDYITSSLLPVTVVHRGVRPAHRRIIRPMRITVLAGGIGAARFLRGLLAAAPDATITVIGNTADDITLFGLRVCPDLDSVMYTLGGGSNEEQGWGRAGETHRIGDELAAYGAGPSWFTLGDLDFATHIARSQLLAEGRPLSEVTRLLCERWQPGVRLLPMSDDRVETRVKLAAARTERVAPGAK